MAESIPDIVLTLSPIDTINATTSHLDESFVEVSHVEYSYHEMMQEYLPEDTGLAAQFRLSLKKLEGLLYAALGSVPASYVDNQQWWLNRNPRCNFPEQVFCDTDENEKRKFCSYPQTATRGKIHGSSRNQFLDIGSTGYFDWSRSDTIPRQYRRVKNHSAYAGIDSTTLTFEVTNGGIQSGDQHGDPPSNVPITIAFTPILEATRVVLYIQIGDNDAASHEMTQDGSSWTYELDEQQNKTQVLFYFEIHAMENGAPVTVYEPHGLNRETPPTLSDIPDDIEGEQPGQNHNHQAAGSSYYFYVLNHRDDYANGLPELIWEDYEGEKRNCLRRCTGTWAFKNWENITPGLINVARFCIDYLGDRFQHDPSLRGPSPRCCFNHNIRFRWTGANVPWLYREGGKSIIAAGETPGTDHTIRPLVNLHSEVNGGSDSSRKTWRGIPGIYRNASTSAGNMAVPYVDGLGNYIAAYDYGNDESWLSWPRYDDYTFRGVWEGNPNADKDEWFPGIFIDHGSRRGLQAGDQIDKIHLLEIIEAVDYLVKYGLWSVVPAKACRRTPITCGPWTTQHFHGDYNCETFEWTENPHDVDVAYPSTQEYSWTPYPPFNWSEMLGDIGISQPCLGGCYYQRATCVFDDCTGYSVTTPAIPYDAPATVDECRSGTSIERHIAPGYCPTALAWGAECSLGDEGGCNRIVLTASCYSPGWMFVGGYSANVPVSNEIHKSCQQTMEGIPNKSAMGATAGWSYYLCGVDKTYFGPTWGWWSDNRSTPKWSTIDEYHGNGVQKKRVGSTPEDPDWEVNCNQYLASMGNKFDLAKRCNLDGEFDYSASTVAFDEVTEIEYFGPATVWAVQQGYPNCPMSTNIEDEIPAIPGLGYYNIPDVDAHGAWTARSPMCHYSFTPNYPDFWPTDMFGQVYNCEIDFPELNNCGPKNSLEFNVYARVDLNTSNGIPQLYDYELNTTYIDANGDPIYTNDLPTYPDTVYSEPTVGCKITYGGVAIPFAANDGIPEPVF